MGPRCQVSPGCCVGGRLRDTRCRPIDRSFFVFMSWQGLQTAWPLLGSSVPPRAWLMMWSASVATCVQVGPWIWHRWLSRRMMCSRVAVGNERRLPDHDVVVGIWCPPWGLRYREASGTHWGRGLAKGGPGMSLQQPQYGQSSQVAPVTPSVVAGWYPDASGRQQWWDGVQWSGQFAPTAAPQQQAQPERREANGMGVSYVRNQKGHSLTLWIILSLFLIVPVIGLIYYSVSPNHYWHA